MMRDVDRQRAFRPGRRIRMRHVWLTGVVAAAALWITWPFVTSILWGALASIAEWPLYRRADARFPRHRLLLATLFTFVTGLVVVIPLSLAAVGLLRESEGALAWLQHAQQSGIAVPPWLDGLPLVGARFAELWQQNLAPPQKGDGLSKSFDAGWLVTWVKTAAGTVARSTGSFVFALLFLGGLLAYGHEIGRRIRGIAGRMDGAFGRVFAERMVEAVRSTVNGTLLVSFGEGLLISAGYLVADVSAPLLFAVLTVLLAPVPFGAWAAFGLASLTLAGEGHLLPGVMLFAFGAVVMQIGDNVVQVAVVGRAAKLPFLLTIVGAVGGMTMLGLIGLFIGPVIMAALLLVWQEWVRSMDAEQAPSTQS